MAGRNWGSGYGSIVSVRIQASSLASHSCGVHRGLGQKSRHSISAVCAALPQKNNMQDNSFTEYIVYDVLGHIADVSYKRMFGGAGIYVAGKIVAIVVEGELYFKADVALIEKYTALGCHPFTYDRDGKQVSMKYMSATESMLEDREVMSGRVEESLLISK